MQATLSTCYTANMYLAIDVGGSKVLLATFDTKGAIKKQHKYPTPKDYQEFLKSLTIESQNLKLSELHAIGVGIPVTSFERDSGLARTFGNLPWKNVHVGRDIERLFSAPIIVENDAKMAGLSEAVLLKSKYSKVLYVTISTGIGTSLVVNLSIDTAFGDAGGRAMILPHNGKYMPWEEFASGSAIVRRYHQLASEIEDENTWTKISRDLSIGLIELIALTQPEVIVLGGSVGKYFYKFRSPLIAELKKTSTPLIHLPVLIGAKRAEDAVIYGCYYLASETYGNN